jgi:hypothetical protein
LIEKGWKVAFLGDKFVELLKASLVIHNQIDKVSGSGVEEV